MLNQFTNLLILGLSNPFYQFHYLFILFLYGLPQDSVLFDEDLGQFGGLSKLLYPRAHLFFIVFVCFLQILDYLGHLRVGIGHYLLLLIFFVSRISDEFRIEIQRKFCLSLDFLDILGYFTKNLIIFLHILNKIIELILDGLTINNWSLGSTLFHKLSLRFLAISIGKQIESVRTLGLHYYLNLRTIFKV